MRKLAEIDRSKLVGLLADQLAFERAAVERYTEALAALRHAEPAVLRILPRLEQQRGDEVANATWLEDELRRLEAPPEVVRARVERVRDEHAALFPLRAGSVVEVVRSLHRLELGDAALWQLLGEVAERAGDDPARRLFVARRDEERGHARFLERVLVELMVNDTLGYPVTLPVSA